MTHRLHRLDLPEHFTVATAAAEGATTALLRHPELRRPFHGVRARGPQPDSLRARCMDYLPRLRAGQFFSHETALHLAGAPMPEWPHVPAMHVATHRPAREPRTVGVRGHRLQTREPAVLWTDDGLPIEHPVRAWRQCGTLWRLDDLIAAGDHLLSGDTPWASVADLAEEVRTMGDTGSRVLHRALRDVRGGVRSPRETRLRLLLVRCGLPEPATGWNLFTVRGTFVAEIDLAFPAYRVAAEYDGRVHAEDSRQFEKDADRWDAIRNEGWDHVRILRHHMMGDGSQAVGKVRDALRRAGWTPGR